MADDLDPLDADQTAVTTRRSGFASHRFARLVQSPVARRLSPRRLVGAVLLGALLVWGFSEVGARAVQGVARWVAAQPEHQIPFDEIELVPAPAPYIHAGAANILGSVRQEAKYAATLPLLTTDLEALRVALSLNPWIEQAGPVRSSYRHLAIGVAYRKPVATILFDPKNGDSVMIDRHGIELPVGPGQVDWTATRPAYQVVGDSHPLIEIHNLGPAVGDRVGLIWRSATPKVDDSRVRQAAQLADFLAQHADSQTPKGRPTPRFTEIHFRDEWDGGEPITGFLLRDSRRNCVFWKSGPGAEAADEPAAARKWANLGRYIDDYGPVDLNRDREYLTLESNRLIVKPFRRK